MKTIRTITFHSSYNYGSCLQAYALQETIKRISNNNVEYKIINLRTNKQKEMYKSFFEKSDFKSVIKKILFFKYKKGLYEKQNLFENFINGSLNLTPEFNSMRDICNSSLKADYYIAGSDQLWNLQAIDFDWSNFLEFVKDGKKISYAASFGPIAQKWTDEERNRIKKDLLEFNCISVREEGSFNNVKELTGIEPAINVDPTMLLSKNEWKRIIPKGKIYNGDYIFLYNLKEKEYVELAYKISKVLKLPVVVSKKGSLEEIIYGFKKKLNVGPLEFLNLIKNAKLVLSSSFHGTIFSILLNKPFFALKGDEDFRIQTLLKKMNLENRSINFNDYNEKLKETYNIDFTEAEKLLEEERKKSENYLKEALEIKN